MQILMPSSRSTHLCVSEMTLLLRMIGASTEMPSLCKRLTPCVYLMRHVDLVTTAEGEQGGSILVHEMV